MDSVGFLNQQINQLGFDEKFIEKSTLMGFQTLNDITSIQPSELISKQDFTYHWLGELINFFEQEGRIYLLQPLPGRYNRL